MGLLKRAVQYREELSLTKPKGLLAKALSFKNLLDNFLERITAATQQAVHMKKGNLERKSFDGNLILGKVHPKST